VWGLFVCLLICLILFFWRAGTHDHREDEIGNHVNFKSLSSSSAENITQERKKERKSRSKNGPFEDSKKLPTSRSACEDLESERALWDFRKPRLSLFELFSDLFVLFLPPEVTSDRFIYWRGGLSLRFHSMLLLSPASSIFGAFYRGMVMHHSYR
jgi:hypothetical protein